MKHNWEIDFTVCFLVFFFLPPITEQDCVRGEHNGLDAGFLLGIKRTALGGKNPESFDFVGFSVHTLFAKRKRFKKRPCFLNQR